MLVLYNISWLLPHLLTVVFVFCRLPVVLFLLLLLCIHEDIRDRVTVTGTCSMSEIHVYGVFCVCVVSITRCSVSLCGVGMLRSDLFESGLWLGYVIVLGAGNAHCGLRLPGVLPLAVFLLLLLLYPVFELPFELLTAQLCVDLSVIYSITWWQRQCNCCHHTYT